MLHDFSTMTDRRRSNSLKWDVPEGDLPMWVADMDFRTAPAIIEAIRTKTNSGVFGYTTVPPEFNRSIADWWERRHNFPISEDWIIFCTGVVPAISSIVRKMTTVGENVLVQSPVYNIFFNSIVNNGRRVVESNLVYDGRRYSIDFEDLETKLADPQTTLMLLCNPHNPIGAVWDAEVLARIGDLAARHHVLVVADEIHCDLTDPDVSYVPFASVSEVCAGNSITCVAPTKAFNLAGIQSSAVVIPNEHIRSKVLRGLNTDEVAEPNAFAIEATIAAFSEAEDWLKDLRRYVHENKQLAADYIRTRIPGLSVVRSEATYLLWIDASAVADETSGLTAHIGQETGLHLSEGRIYGQSGAGFLRMNVACPRERLMDGLDRLRSGVEAYRAIYAPDA
jgi:cystathionine beta-lyase